MAYSDHPYVEKRAERRKEFRFKTNQPGMVTVLGGPIGKRSPVLDACLLDMAGSGLRLRAPEALACGTPVRIDANEISVLGNVLRCVAEDGAYTVGIELTKGLGPLNDMEKLNQALMGVGITKHLDVKPRRSPGRPARTRS